MKNNVNCVICDNLFSYFQIFCVFSYILNFQCIEREFIFASCVSIYVTSKHLLTEISCLKLYVEKKSDAFRRCICSSEFTMSIVCTGQMKTVTLLLVKEESEKIQIVAS